MDKKNTILLTVIAIATLLVAVVGATFAYFATTQDIAANIPANINTAGTAASFTSTVDGDINIQVDANEMQQADSDDNTVIPGLTDTAKLSVSLGAAQDGQSSVCTYDIIFTWTSDKSDFKYGDAAAVNDYYVRTVDVDGTGIAIPKEFTIQAEGTNQKASSTTTTVTGITTGGVLSATTEYNFDEYTVEGQREIVDPSDPNAKINADYFTLLKGLTIESDSQTTPTKVDWVFTAKFYNATKDQSVQMGRSYSGMISVNPATIKC